jgi:hypothetical protein
MLTTDPIRQLDDILGTSITEFDIPDDIFARAVDRYQHLAHDLSEYWPDSHPGGEVYPQGSARLGTMTRPINPRDEYDIDLVCRRDLRKESTTQQELKSDVGVGLKQYVATGPDGTPQLSEGNRCWTLDYRREPFHMDVLPALPDTEAIPNGILLTDRGLHEWQRSNPVDHADWFRGRMLAEFIQLREAAAVAKRLEVEAVPDWQVKTTLQRTVQALKRHRDLHFTDSPDNRPASIIITTLAAHAYRGQGSLYEVLVDVVESMPSFVEDRGGILWVSNPVQPKENFADRWRTHPGRARSFFDWMERAQHDFAGIGEERGLDRIVTKLAESFGEAPAHRAGDRFAAGATKARDSAVLGVSAGTAMLGTARSRPVPRHTFHGDAPPRRRP